MSETITILIGSGGVLLVTVPFAVFGWKRADRDAAKAIAKSRPPAGVVLSDAATRWLHDQTAKRLRWSVVAMEVGIALTAPLVFAFRDAPVVDDVGHMHPIVAMYLGYTFGATFATIHSARANLDQRRSAMLTPRTLHTYLRGWERGLYIAHLAAAALATSVAVVLLLTGRHDHAGFFLGLSATWLALVGSIELLQRWVLHSPPPVAEHLHIAREMVVSLAIRSLLLMQLQVLAVCAVVLVSYLSVTQDGFPAIPSLSPLYAAAAAALAMQIARTNRQDRGAPAPEWYFARTLEPTP